jgi:hypothetical protein
MKMLSLVLAVSCFFAVDPARAEGDGTGSFWPKPLQQVRTDQGCAFSMPGPVKPHPSWTMSWGPANDRYWQWASTYKDFKFFFTVIMDSYASGSPKDTLQKFNVILNTEGVKGGVLWKDIRSSWLEYQYIDQKYHDGMQHIERDYYVVDGNTSTEWIYAITFPVTEKLSKSHADELFKTIKFSSGSASPRADSNGY